MPTIQDYARIYASRYNFHLVPIEPLKKYPTSNDWGNTAISDPVEAFNFWNENQSHNMGVALGPSNMCSLDIDDADGFKLILDEFGIPSEELDRFPTIRGKGKRIMFQVPHGYKLPYCKINWPREEDPKKHFTVFELRAACDGSQKQDILPPSIHCDTLQPYEWIVKPPKTLKEWPTPPDFLLAIWMAFDKFKPQMVDACPWKVKEYKAPPALKIVRSGDVPDVQGQFNAANDLETMLVTYGYKKVGKRYLSPHSGTGLAGVHMLSASHCWIHHASDPLCSEDNGQPVSAYDLYCEYEHGGDKSAAFKAAADLVGISLKPAPVVQIKPASVPAVYDPDPFSPLPFCTDKGVPLAHIKNLAEICRRLGVIIRYNVISKEEELLIPNEAFSMDNEGNASLAWLESECSLYKMPTSKMTGFVTYIADTNPYNPVAEWVGSKTWDGIDRLTEFLNTVAAKSHDDLKNALITKWMVSAIEGAFSPTGVSASGVLVFQGDQYVGKTKWFKSLVPEEKKLIKDGVILRPDDRDSVKQAVSFWLVELGELDSTFRKADIAALKAFLTSQMDVLRRAYAKKESQYARRTVFFGSVNPKQFLHDPTGNRRYWTIEVTKLDHSHNIDMQQVWAQVYELYKSGFGHHLTPDEMEALNDHNEDFTASDPIEDVVISKFDWNAAPSLWTWKTATEALQICGYDRPTKAELNTAASMIRKLNGNLSKRTNSSKLLFLPPQNIR